MNLYTKSLIVSTIICLLSVTLTVTNCQSKNDNKIPLTQEDVLILTENAFLEGYKAGLLKQDNDSIWSEISKRYKFNSDQRIIKLSIPDQDLNLTANYVKN